jgi:hypothetical protein
MNNIKNEFDNIVNELVADIDIPEDVPVMYEVWAVGYDEEDNPIDAELLIGIFEDPDEAVCFARSTTTANVLELAEDDNYQGFDSDVHYIHVEVETVVVSDEDGTMNIGAIYKKTLELFEEFPNFIHLTNDEFQIVADGNIAISCELIKEYNVNDAITIIFEDASYPEPIEYKIIAKDGKYYICEFNL